MDISARSSFTLFPDLPTEIRLQIWRLSCLPRVVTLRWQCAHDRYYPMATPIPAVLAVNCESRSEAKKLYSYLMTPDPVLFAPELDTLYITRPNLLGYSLEAREVASYLVFAADIVRSLAIDHVMPEHRRDWETYNKWCLIRSFPKLQEVYLTLSGPEYLGRGVPCETGTAMELIEPTDATDRVEKAKEDFLESWIYDLSDERDSYAPGVQDTSLDDQIRKNRYLTTILKARRGKAWLDLWLFREAREVFAGTESEWWTSTRKGTVAVPEERDGTVYQTKGGTSYYQKVKA